MVGWEHTFIQKALALFLTRWRSTSAEYGPHRKNPMFPRNFLFPFYINKYIKLMRSQGKWSQYASMRFAVVTLLCDCRCEWGCVCVCVMLHPITLCQPSFDQWSLKLPTSPIMKKIAATGGTKVKWSMVINTTNDWVIFTLLGALAHFA